MKTNPLKLLLATLAISKQVQAVTDSPEEGLEVAMCLTGALAAATATSRARFIDMVNSMRDRMIAAYDEQHPARQTERPAPKTRDEAMQAFYEEFNALDHSNCKNPDGSHNCKHSDFFDQRMAEIDKQFPRKRPFISPVEVDALFEAVLKASSSMH
jgi:hypothetical protein